MKSLAEWVRVLCPSKPGVAYPACTVQDCTRPGLVGGKCHVHAHAQEPQR